MDRRNKPESMRAYLKRKLPDHSRTEEEIQQWMILFGDMMTGDDRLYQRYYARRASNQPVLVPDTVPSEARGASPVPVTNAAPSDPQGASSQPVPVTDTAPSDPRVADAADPNMETDPVVPSDPRGADVADPNMEMDPAAEEVSPSAQAPIFDESEESEEPEEPEEPMWYDPGLFPVGVRFTVRRGHLDYEKNDEQPTQSEESEEPEEPMWYDPRLFPVGVRRRNKQQDSQDPAWWKYYKDELQDSNSATDHEESEESTDPEKPDHTNYQVWTFIILNEVPEYPLPRRFNHLFAVVFILLTSLSQAYCSLHYPALHKR
ncbi:hypothetical protein F5Y18DRAFT_429528 [Xylariaceae sp. FL1019]|nr:hypothetical protein F5Y18DRAFT_429528 [Xylariaceae sp. FL1019]